MSRVTGTEDDIFGIKYQPYRKKGSNASVKIEDEEEFERDLLTKQPTERVGSNANDDEFDFDDNADNSSNIATSTWVPAVKDVEEIIIENEAEKFEETSVVDVIVSEEPKGLSIRDAAMAAYNEIKSVYSVGGVGGVSIGEEDNTNEVIIVDRNITSIQEGDEEEEDEKEEVSETVNNVDQLDIGINDVVTPSADDDLHQVWDDINNKPKNDDLVIDAASDVAADAASQPILYQDALAYLLSLPLDKYKSVIKISENTTSSSFNPFSWLSTKLSYDSHERDLPFPFLLAQVDYDPADIILRRMLVTIYSSLLFPLKTSCPIVGEHWDKIGFQGTDPRTDINRSMKMLSLLQMLHLVENHHVFARNLCILASTISVPGSKLDTSWPLFCVSIGFTKEALQALRSGILYKRCNKHKSVLLALHDFHRACFYDFVTRLTADPATHMAIHLNKTKDICDKNPLVLLRNLKKYDLNTSIAYSEGTFDSNERVDSTLTDLINMQVSAENDDNDTSMQATNNNRGSKFQV